MFIKLIHHHPLMHWVHEGGCDHAHVVILQHPAVSNTLSYSAQIASKFVNDICPWAPEFPLAPSITAPTDKPYYSLLTSQD